MGSLLTLKLTLPAKASFVPKSEPKAMTGLVKTTCGVQP